MTMRGINSLADKLKLWQQLRAGAGRLLDDLPHLRPEVAAFETELRNLVAIDEEHAATTARLRELTRLRAEAQVRVRGLRNRIAAMLQGHYGPESDTLIEYGIAPRHRRPRRKPEPEADAATTSKPSEPEIKPRMSAPREEVAAFSTMRGMDLADPDLMSGAWRREGSS